MTAEHKESRAPSHSTPTGRKKHMPSEPVVHLADLEHYEQDSGPNITYQFVVKPGTMGLLSAGRVCLTGPTRKTCDIHNSWDQVYIVLSGNGSVVVDGKTYPVHSGYIVRIPKGTSHGVELKDGDRLEYCYFNAFESQKAIEAFCGRNR